MLTAMPPMSLSKILVEDWEAAHLYDFLVWTQLFTPVEIKTYFWGMDGYTLMQEILDGKFSLIDESTSDDPDESTSDDTTKKKRLAENSKKLVTLLLAHDQQVRTKLKTKPKALASTLPPATGMVSATSSASSALVAPASGRSMFLSLNPQPVSSGHTALSLLRSPSSSPAKSPDPSQLLAESSKVVQDLFAPLWTGLDKESKQLAASNASSNLSSNPSASRVSLTSDKQNAEELSRRFASTNLLGYEDKILDGFRVTYADSGETVVIDATIEPELSGLIKSACKMLTVFKTPEKRALALAQLCKDRLGGGSSNPTNLERYQKFVNGPRLNMSPQGPEQASDKTNTANFAASVTTSTSAASVTTTKSAITLAQPQPYIVSMGALIKVGGLDRHCALLYKYLADRTANLDPDNTTVDIEISCSLVHRSENDSIYSEVSVRNIGGSIENGIINFQATPPRIEKAKNTRILQSVARVDYNVLATSREEVSSTEFISMWNRKLVRVRHSDLPRKESNPSSYDINTFMREADILANTRHSSIIKMPAICVQQEQKPQSESGQGLPTIAMVFDMDEAVPLVGKLLTNSPVRDKLWTFERQLNFGLQLSQALSELHAFGLALGPDDLNIGSLLFTSDWGVKVADFKASRYVKNSASQSAPLGYRAPELLPQSSLEKSLKPTEASDVYAFGCVMYAVALGKEPWDDLNREQNLIAAIDPMLPKIPAAANVDPRLAKVINHCFLFNAADRPKFDEIAEKLKNILDSIKPKKAVLSGIAATPTTVNLQALSAGLANTNSSVDSQDIIKKLGENLKPLGDDTVTIAREKFCSSLGMIDPFMIVPRSVEGLSFFVVHRQNSIAFVTNGIWDPNEIHTSANSTTSSSMVSTNSNTNSNISTDKNAATFSRMELLAEAPASEVADDRSKSWLYQCLLKVACIAKRDQNKMLRVLQERSYATLEIKDIDLPPQFLNPLNKRACMLLGVKRPKEILPEFFEAPHNGMKVPVMIVTARLLTYKQWQASQEFVGGKKPLAARFEKAGTHHISSLNPLIYDKLEIASSEKSEANSALKLDPKWTVERLRQRIKTLLDFDATKGSGKAGSASTTTNPPPASMFTTLEDLAENDESSIVRPVSAATGPGRNIVKKWSPPPSQPTFEAIPKLEDEDIPTYEPPVPTGVFVEKFHIGHWASILSTLTVAIGKILSSDSTSSERLKATAKVVKDALGMQSQLYGWYHVSEYIRDPKQYIEQTLVVKPEIKEQALKALKATHSIEETKVPQEIHDAIYTLQTTGNNLVKRLLWRIQWIIGIFIRENTDLNCETLLLLIGTDRSWIDEVTEFLNKCEFNVAELTSKNPLRFNQLRDLQRKVGVPWQHSPSLLSIMLAAGFEYRPMMIKRDNLICSVCGARVSGLRPFHQPETFHRYEIDHSAARVNPQPQRAKDYDICSITEPLLSKHGLINTTVNTADSSVAAAVSTSRTAAFAAVTATAAFPLKTVDKKIASPLTTAFASSSDSASSLTVVLEEGMKPLSSNSGVASLSSDKTLLINRSPAVVANPTKQHSGENYPAEAQSKRIKAPGPK